MESMTFEKAFARLEEILRKMNEGAASLDESMKLYMEADELIGSCSKQLSDAEQKIQKLMKNREGKLDTPPAVEPFDPRSGSEVPF